MVKIFLKLALPAMVTNVMIHASFFINIYFAGRLDDPVKLAAVGMTNVICNIVILPIMLGLNAA